jgi:hypothetical protein
MFPQDNAAPYHQNLADLHSEVLKHPPNFKKLLKERKCLSTEEVEGRFAAQPKEFLLGGLKESEQCVELRDGICGVNTFVQS